MLISILVIAIPLLQIICGIFWRRNPPKDHYFGFRTNWTVKTEDTWSYSHRYIGRQYVRFGLAFLVLGIIVVIIKEFSKLEMMTDFSTVFVILEFLMLFLPVLFSERELRRRFDQEGKRKKE